MKSTILRSLALVLSLCATACTSGSSSKQTLLIYSPHGKELLGDFAQLYEAEHPNVKVQWLDMGSQEVFDRISTEAQNPQADIWWGAPATMFMRAEKLGLLLPYQPTWAASVPTSARSRDHAWYGTFSTPEVIAFNDKMLTAARAPADWDDLATPTWKGKVILRNPMASGTLRSIFCARLQQSVARTGSEKAGWDWLRALNANTSSYAADATQMYTGLGGEHEAVTLWNMPDIVLQKNKNAFPFGYVFPKGGTVVLTDGIALVKGTKHEALAKSFYEFVTSPESLLRQADKYYRIPSRTDLPKDKLPAWLKTCTYTALPIDWEQVAQHEAQWMQRWDSEVKTVN